MKRIILYIAASLDGRIAEPGGGIDFLTDYPITDQMNYGYNEFISSVDTIIMGGKSYRDILCMDSVWPYGEQTTYVISRRNWGTTDNIKFITDHVIETIEALRDQPGKDIWLFGGGEIVSLLLQEGLVDEMQISYVPVILGKGISLFPQQPTVSVWRLTDSKTYDNGILSVTYMKK